MFFIDDVDSELGSSDIQSDSSSSLSNGSLNGTHFLNGTVGGRCPTLGCKGYGHIKGPRYYSHQRLSGCPYADLNLNRDAIRAHERLTATNIVPSSNNSPVPNDTDMPDILNTTSITHCLSPDSTVKSTEGIVRKNPSNSLKNGDELDVCELEDQGSKEVDDEVEEEELNENGSTNQCNPTGTNKVKNEEFNLNMNSLYQVSMASLSGLDQLKLNLLQNTTYSSVIKNLLVPACLQATAYRSNFFNVPNESSPLNLSLDRHQNESTGEDVKDLSMNASKTDLTNTNKTGLIMAKGDAKM